MCIAHIHVNTTHVFLQCLVIIIPLVQDFQIWLYLPIMFTFVSLTRDVLNCDWACENQPCEHKLH